MFIICIHLSRLGVIAKNLDWKGDIPDFVDGEVEPIQTIVSNASIDVETVTNNLTGSNLWQMSVFASSTKSAGPDDILLPYFDQILTDEQSRQAIPEDGVLRFYNLETPPFQVDRMGCGKFKFLCYRFQKASYSDASFAFHGESGGKYVLNCQKLICKGKDQLLINLHSCHCKFILILVLIAFNHQNVRSISLSASQIFVVVILTQKGHQLI